MLSPGTSTDSRKSQGTTHRTPTGLRALDVLARYRLGTAVEVTGTAKIDDVKRLIEDLALNMEPFVRERDFPRLLDAWNDALRSRFPAVGRQ